MAKNITACAGRRYGHVPGHNFLDVAIECAPCGSRWIATMVVTAGSAQESHGRNDQIHWSAEYSATGGDAEDAIGRVQREALDADDNTDELVDYIHTAASRALREACADCSAAAE